LSRHESIVNIDKFLREEHRRYKMSAFDAIVVEAGMNSFGQAGMAEILKYKIINDRFDPRLDIIDNGKGMTPKQFDEYHNFYSESSKMVIGDINFLGMGSKPMLQRAKHVVTETKSMSNHLASRWWYDIEQKKAIWDDIYDMQGIQTPTGTRVGIYLKENEDIKNNNEKHLTDLVQYHFMGVLLGEYGNTKKILVEDGSGENIITSKYPHPKEYPEKLRHIHTFDKLGDFDGERYPPRCMFTYSDKPLADGDYGLFIIVGKKTIQCQDGWFGCFPQEGKHKNIRGYVFADYLVDIVNDGKNGFDTSKKKWKEFYENVAKELVKFLEKIGAKTEKPVVDEETLKISEKVAEEFNENLKKWDLIDLLGEKKKKEKPDIPPLPKAKCPYCGSDEHITYEEDEAWWLCLKCNQKFPKKWHGQRKGKKKRGAITFTYWDDVTGEFRLKASWWDATERAIAINTSLPTWKYVEGTPKASEYYHKEVGLRALIEESSKILPEQREEIFFQYFNDFIKA
jgi:hypothetical protein